MNLTLKLDLSLIQRRALNVYITHGFSWIAGSLQLVHNLSVDDFTQQYIWNEASFQFNLGWFTVDQVIFKTI